MDHIHMINLNVMIIKESKNSLNFNVKDFKFYFLVMYFIFLIIDFMFQVIQSLLNITIHFNNFKF